jgi:NACalpha-BTF3-like transcription factor
MENPEKEKEETVHQNFVENNTITESNIILSESDVERKRQENLVKEYYIKLQKQKYERFIEITMNQTTYTRDEAIASLEKHKGDISLVIKEFLGVVDKSEEREKEKNSKSLHQKRYGIIRDYMDNASINYMKKQEEAKRYNEFLERHKKAKEQQQQEQEKQEQEQEKQEQEQQAKEKQD